MVAPGAVVGDIDALFAFAAGGHQAAIHVDHGPVKKRRGLSGPDALADIVKNIDQGVHVASVKTATEIASRGRIGQATGAEGIEKDLVVAPQFQVLQASAVAQGVIRQVEHVIGLVVRQMDFQHVQTLVDGVDQADAPRQQVDGADAAMGDAVDPVADVIVNIPGGEHGLLVAADVRLVQATVNAALAVGQFSPYDLVHSKSLHASG